MLQKWKTQAWPHPGASCWGTSPNVWVSPGSWTDHKLRPTTQFVKRSSLVFFQSQSHRLKGLFVVISSGCRWSLPDWHSTASFLCHAPGRETLHSGPSLLGRSHSDFANDVNFAPTTFWRTAWWRGIIRKGCFLRHRLWVWKQTVADQMSPLRNSWREAWQR